MHIGRSSALSRRTWSTYFHFHFLYHWISNAALDNRLWLSFRCIERTTRGNVTSLAAQLNPHEFWRSRIYETSDARSSLREMNWRRFVEACDHDEQWKVGESVVGVSSECQVEWIILTRTWCCAWFTWTSILSSTAPCAWPEYARVCRLHEEMVLCLRFSGYTN